MNTLYGTIDLGSYVGAEHRVIDGEECIVIPLRYNASIVPLTGHPTAMFKLRPMPQPDAEGFTYAAHPHVPKSRDVAPSDRVKMTRQVGRFMVLFPGHGQAIQDGQESTPGLDHSTLAANPVKEDIPL